jgi:hypothetical protein
LRGIELYRAGCYSHDDQAIIMSSNESTIESVCAGIIYGDPEFLDAIGVEKHFGIRRSLLFRLLAEKQIRGVSIRQKGRLRGKRLFVYASIRKFLLSNAVIARPIALSSRSFSTKRSHVRFSIADS